MKKRDLVKYVRDKAKSGYNRLDHCEICGSSDRLEFHHFYGLSSLLELWMKKNRVTDIIAERDRFIEEHYAELYEEAATLCKKHHDELHSVYGRKPRLSSAPKQKRWVERKKCAYTSESSNIPET